MHVRDVMTPDPVVLPGVAKLPEAAALMRDREIGDVLVTDGDALRGIVTDRDMVIRAIADNRVASETPLEDICTPNPVTIGPGEHCDGALGLMAEHAVRRLPVIENGRLVGLVTLNDISSSTDVGEATAKIAAAPATL